MLDEVVPYMSAADNSESASLLTYRMPLWRRAGLYLLSILLAGGMATILIVIVMLARTRHIVLLITLDVILAFATVWAVRQLLKSVVALRASADCLEITMISGAQKLVAWPDIRKLRHLTKGVLVLYTADEWFFLVQLPDRILAGLVAILRETSDARIMRATEA